MQDIYQQELMDIYRNPMNRGAITEPTVKVEENNPFCGDSINLYLTIGNNKIMDAKYEGEACAVSVISSSMLTEEIIGKTIPEVKQISKEQLLDMLNMNLTTSRVKCATLILNALKKAIDKYEQTN